MKTPVGLGKLGAKRKGEAAVFVFGWIVNPGPGEVEEDAGAKPRDQLAVFPSLPPGAALNRVCPGPLNIFSSFDCNFTRGR